MVECFDCGKKYKLTEETVTGAYIDIDKVPTCVDSIEVRSKCPKCKNGQTTTIDLKALVLKALE